MNRNETVVNLFQDLGIDQEHDTPSLKQLTSTDSRFLRDLKLNVSNVLNSKNLTQKEAFLLALSAAINEQNQVLADAFSRLARNQGASEEEISETYACTAVMNVNNVFYRFRHYMAGTEYYEKQPAGLRMSVMMNPTLGKEFFELMSLAVSALNGCERCVTSHESSVKQQGAEEPRIYDAIRLVSVIKSLCLVI